VTLTALRGLRNVRDAQIDTADLARAQELARELMTEILDQPYEEPLDTIQFGPEASEVTTPETRANFDDVDDYKDWNKDNDLVIQEKDGTPLNIAGDWVRTADVEFVKDVDLSKANGADVGVKRVIVTVERGGKQLVTLVGTVSKHWQLPPYD
jgi:hypothetical protein